MEIKKDFLYTTDHIWVKMEGENVRLGLTGYLQKDIGDVLLVELPETGKEVSEGKNFGLIETSKAVVDLKSPVTGRVLQVNNDISDDPDALKDDPFGKGWLVVIKLDSSEQLDALMSPEKYKEFIKG